MGFDKGKIVLDADNGAYYAGQTINGKIVFDQDKIKTVRGIYVKVIGYAHVHWTTRHTRKVNDRQETYTVNHDANEEYINMKHYLVGGENGEYNIHPGKHEFPFQCLIPMHSPSSFEGSYGHIRYEVKVVVDRPYKIDQEKKATFKVIAPLDLNIEPYCKEPIEMEFEDSYCCWCISSGSCDTVVKLPVSGFCPGQLIPVEVSCANKSNVEINRIRMKIIKKMTFHAHSSPGTKYGEEKIVEIKKGPIPSNTTRNWTVDLEIPAVDVCNVNGCRIIDVDYVLKVKVVPSGCHKSTEDTRRVVLGNVPIRGFQDNIPNPLQHQMPNKPIPSITMSLPSNPGVNTGPQISPYPTSSPYPTASPHHTGTNAPYPIGSPKPNPPYPGGQSPYPGANPPYPASNSPYPAPNPAYPGVSPPYPGVNPPYPTGSPYPAGAMTMPVPQDPRRSPSIGFKTDDAKQETTMPLLPYPPGPAVVPYSAPSAPAIDNERGGVNVLGTPTQQYPYNPQFMAEMK